MISLNEHASHLKIGAFEDGVLAEFVLDGYHGVLQGCLLVFLTLGSFPLHSCDIEKNVVNYRDEVSVHVTVTIGISSYHGGTSIQDMMDDADAKLYYGKRHGKNQVVSELPTDAVV